MDKNYSININNMITLCHILDEFKEFEERLLQVISQKNNRDFIFQLWDISEGKFKLGAIKAKKFYSENKSIIDTINNYSNVPTFINQSYSCYGEPEENTQFFYEYLLKHKEEIPKILELLQKLKQLGFSNFEFNEDLDFTKETYNINPIFKYNFYITYFANAEAVPNYLNHIEYKTSNSNYKMMLNVIGDDFCIYGSEIILNSLLFDPNTLPAKIDRENIFEPILSLQKEQNEKNTLIKKSVDLSISISNLENQLNLTNWTINKLDGVKNKEELLEVLSNIRENVERLKTLSTEHNNSVLKEEPSLTPEVLEREKKRCLRRIEMERIDLC